MAHTLRAKYSVLDLWRPLTLKRGCPRDRQPLYGGSRKCLLNNPQFPTRQKQPHQPSPEIRVAFYRFAEVQHQYRQRKGVRNRVFQLGHNQPQPALTLCKAELPFHFYAVCFVLVVLPFVADLTLFGPSKGRPGSANPQSFAELKVLSGAVDLVRQNSPRIVPRPVEK